MFGKNYLLPELKNKGDCTGETEHNGYVMIKKPSHPHAWRNGYVKIHRLVVEKSLGRHLNNDEHVHHIDRDKRNNHISNLEIVTMSEHRIIHNNETKDYSSKWDLNKIKKLYEKGSTTREIAKITGMGKSNVSHHLRKLGVSNSHKASKVHLNNPNNERKITDEEIKEINRLRKESCTVKVIIEKTGYSRDTIYKYLDKDLISK